MTKNKKGLLRYKLLRDSYLILLNLSFKIFTGMDFWLKELHKAISVSFLSLRNLLKSTKTKHNKNQEQSCLLTQHEYVSTPNSML